MTRARPWRGRAPHAPLPTLLAAALAAALTACAPPLEGTSVTALEPSAGGAGTVVTLFGRGFPADVEVALCGVPVDATVGTAGGDAVAAGALGRTITFSAPYRPSGSVCEVLVTLGDDVVTLPTPFTYDRAVLVDRSVLVFAHVAARYTTAIDEALDRLATFGGEVDRVYSWFDLTRRLTNEPPDVAVVFGGLLDEPTPQQADAVTRYLLDGGRLVLASWRLDPAVGAAQPNPSETRRLATTLGVADFVGIPSTAVDPLRGLDVVELDLDPDLGASLPAPLPVQRSAYLSIATKLIPAASAERACGYAVPPGGALCALVNAQRSGLVLGANVEETLQILTRREFGIYLENLASYLLLPR
jgi:hypothetical protein